MHPIIYDVAVSLDGFISGPSSDISQFANEGPVVDDYQARMAGYASGIMGRRTYEIGYASGLQKGENPYPHMETTVFSQTLTCPQDSDILVQSQTDAAVIKQLKKKARGPIYLCGGGAFAGWMCTHGLIDRVILKRAPCVLGGGVSLFGSAAPVGALTRVKTKTYENGYLLEEFVFDS